MNSSDQPTEMPVTEHPTTEHEEIERLLPWLANGELPGEERERAEAHCAGCEKCRDQLAALKAMRQQVRAAGDREAGPSRDLLTPTLARIEAEAPRERQARSWLAWWQTTPAPAQFALAAQLLLLLGLLAVLFAPADRGPVVTAGTGPGAGAAAGGPRIQVGFAPAATEGVIREAVLAVDGEIVAGPTALGLYTVELPGEGDEDALVAAALTRLRGQAGVVEYAEPLPRGNDP